MSWLDDYAAALGVDSLNEDQIEAILDLARDVAHGSERKNAPPAAFLAAGFIAAGGDMGDAVSRARELLD